jgi:hypothetical protein
MITIIDDFLEKDLIEHLEEILVYKTPHTYGHTSGFDNNFIFYSSGINTEDILISYIIKKLKNKFNFNKVLRSYINVQFHNMNGNWHPDDGSNTILIMITKTLNKNSGQFQIKINNKIKKVDFIQNRVICFDSTLFHRGLAPKEINTPRITLAFKTI